MNTPVTDAAEMGFAHKVIAADLARQLERDRARLLKVIAYVFRATTDISSRVNLEAALASLEIKDKP